VNAFVTWLATRQPALWLAAQTPNYGKNLFDFLQSNAKWLFLCAVIGGAIYHFLPGNRTKANGVGEFVGKMLVLGACIAIPTAIWGVVTLFGKIVVHGTG
jgi:hypothetical protein